MPMTMNMNGVIVRVIGADKLLGIGTALNEADAKMGAAISLAANEYIEVVRDNLPFYLQEKVFADVIRVSPHSATILFTSRGEPEEQTRRKVWDSNQQKVVTTRSRPGLDAIIEVELERAIDDTDEWLSSVTAALTQDVILDTLRKRGFKVIDNSMAGGISIKAPAGGVFVSGSHATGGRFMSPGVFGIG